MSRLIDANVLMEDIIKRFHCKPYIEVGNNCEYIHNIIDDQPTIEAVEVVRGEWERTDITDEDGWALYRCTHCDWHTTYYYSFSASPVYNFCPNCGADMRKEGAE